MRFTTPEGTKPHPTIRPPTKKKKKPAADSEAAIQKKIIQWLQAQGAVVTRVNSGFVRDPQGNVFNGANAGTSDILCCWKGMYTAIEVKRPGNKPTAKQQAFLDKVIAAGGIAFVATSVDDVKAEFQKALML